MEINSSTTQLTELLSSNKKLLDGIILDFLPTKSSSPEIQSLYEMMRDYPSRGGKGIRGTLCLLWCELFSGAKQKALITASSLELFQNWILIHDDIEDQSDLRRGLPSLHKKYGVELSINAGDALHGKMWELLLSNCGNLGSELTLAILSEFARMLNETTEGQQIELAWTSGNDWDIREEDYALMVTKKSAWYTCISPSRLGIILSTAGHKDENLATKKHSELLKTAVEFGRSFGIAFQIIDDVLNLTADESKYGKEILGDLFEGKRTLMLIHLLNSLEGKRKTNVIESISKPRQSKTTSEMKIVFELMKSSGSIDYARKVAVNHSRQAMKLFEETVSTQSSIHPRIYHQTKSLLEYLSSRDF
ncbi:MAG: polyprenyl synthetase family protein [Thaumarchaeota archaeon]|nr:polyprenyl synthetase family protein [Nitrososphaerota archaeon]